LAWQAAGSSNYIYSAADLDGYAEPEEFTNLVPLLKGRQFQRAMQLRSMAPI
jgi:hypothetical protein